MTRLCRVLKFSGVVAVLLLLAGCAATRLNEYYYHGTYDPEAQLPQEVYRYRVNGFAGNFSSLKFASGWLPKDMVDPLDTQLKFDKDDKIGTTSNTKGTFDSFRPLYIFGPEGFRKAPQDHRFCIVMSQNPEKIFQMAAKFSGRKSEQQLKNEQTVVNGLLERRKTALERLLLLESQGGDDE